MSEKNSKPVFNSLAKHINSASFAADNQIAEQVRLALIDTLGCISVGARQDVAIKTLRAVEQWGNGCAQVIGQDCKLPSPWAAMVNGVAAHSMEFDDWEIPGNTHPSGVLFPALLAASSQTVISGQQLINAYVAGFEVIARLGEVINYEHYDNGWHATSTLGTIGAAAAVSRLLYLSDQQTANAMAMSVSMAGGLTRQFGSDTKPMHAGIAAKSGLLAATLAEQGISGHSNVLEGRRGYNALTSHGDDDKFRSLADKLNGPWALSEYGLNIKPYPTCGYTHRLIDCAFEIRSQMAIDWQDISSITASLPDFHAAILPYEQPLNRVQAQFSVPYCCAVALLSGEFGIDKLETDWRDSSTVKLLIGRSKLNIRAPLHPQLNYDPQDPDWLEVIDNKGNRWRAESVYPLGTPQNPMSVDQIYAKYESNAEKIPTVQLRNWPTADNINQLITD